MGHYRSRVIRVVAGAALAALPLLGVQAETLVYKGENKWVAPEDNKPLQALLKQARGGKVRYSVKLPTENRALAVARLEVIKDLLAREAKSGVVMEETGVAKAGTLGIE